MITRQEIGRLERLAAEMRLHIVRLMVPGEAGPMGASLAAADLVTALYFYKMRHDPANPRWAERDRFVVGKGLALPAQCAALAMLGILAPGALASLPAASDGDGPQGQPLPREAATEDGPGSPEEGLPYAVGLALAARQQGLKYRVYCLLGDGEWQEGPVWEAAATAAQHRLAHLTAILEHDGLAAPVAVAGWAVREVDGHDMGQVCRALDWASGLREAPGLILARTVWGRGVSFLESWAGSQRLTLTAGQHARAAGELEAHLQAAGEGDAA